ncbi:hypothetical protein JW887_02860, partial [Candidatus Dojkabacteria bacterium]|nr:hypothetical protein [Candidatus Dojkabacteria bacterium]
MNPIGMKRADEEQALQLIKNIFEKKAISKTDSFIGIQYNPLTILENKVLKSLLRLQCKETHIIQSIASIEDLSTLNLASFEASLKDITQSESLRDKLTNWKIIIPFEIILKKRHVSVNGLDFKILSYSKIKAEYPLEFNRFYKGKLVATSKIENRQCKYLVVESTGYSLYRAWKAIEPTYNLLRGLLDYAILYNTWKILSMPQVRTKIPHAQTVYGISSVSQIGFLDFHVQKLSRKPSEINPEAKQKFEKYSEVLRKKHKKNSINELLSDIIRLYNQALEEDKLYYGFLKFWQIAERIAITNPYGTSNDTIKKRILFFTQPTPGFDLTTYVDDLSKKRNELVHRGIDEIEENDFNILKSICEVAIEWLFFNRRVIKTINHL